MSKIIKPDELKTDGLAATRGDTLVCHVCKLEVAEIVRDISFGEPIVAEMFKSKTNREIRNGDPADCPKCGANLFIHGLAHVVKENKNAPKLQLPEPV